MLILKLQISKNMPFVTFKRNSRLRLFIKIADPFFINYVIFNKFLNLLVLSVFIYKMGILSSTSQVEKRTY